MSAAWAGSFFFNSLWAMQGSGRLAPSAFLQNIMCLNIVIFHYFILYECYLTIASMAAVDFQHHVAVLFPSGNPHTNPTIPVDSREAPILRLWDVIYNLCSAIKNKKIIHFQNWHRPWKGTCTWIGNIMFHSLIPTHYASENKLKGRQVQTTHTKVPKF